nr:MAG TPA: hypothetical protein [Herelleviridae sp.]
MFFYHLVFIFIIDNGQNRFIINWKYRIEDLILSENNRYL